MDEIERAAEAVLIAHSRMDIASCLCGWSELGRSHPGHQVRMLTGAGLIANRRTQDRVDRTARST